MKKIAVLYLARAAEGLEKFERFSSSYRQYSAGQDHDLIIIYKGKFKRAQKSKAESIFREIPHQSFAIPDKGYDIHAYLHVAEQINHQYICPFNTHSEILSLNWLKKLYSHMNKPNVGIVGSSASYESLLSSNKLLKHILWLYSNERYPKSPELEKHFSWYLQGTSARIFSIKFWTHKRIRKAFFMLLYPINIFILKIGKKIIPNTRVLEKIESWTENHGLSFAYMRWLIRSFFYKNKKPTFIPNDIKYDHSCLQNSFEEDWERATGKGSVLGYLKNHPSFPNPHIRSNGFMVKREFFLEFKDIENTKEACCEFESGFDGITAQVLKKGLSALLVGADGKAYPPEEWPQSRTFRLENQDNLITRDNQSSNYMVLSELERKVQAYMSWGDYTGTPLPIVISLGPGHKFTKVS